MAEEAEYAVYRFNLPLTVSDLSEISNALETVAATIKDAVADQAGNTYPAWLILQIGDTQFAVLPDVENWRDLLRSLLIKLDETTRKVGYERIDDIVSTATKVDIEEVTSPDQPWARTSAEPKLMERCLKELRKASAYKGLYLTAYRMLVLADKTPISDVLFVPDAPPTIKDLARTYDEAGRVPEQLLGYEVVAITGDIDDTSLNNLLNLRVARVVFNSVTGCEEVFGATPNLVTVQANYVRYTSQLWGDTIAVGTGIELLAITPDSTPTDATVIAYAGTATGDEYPTVFGCNLNGSPIIWDLLGAGITGGRAPRSYQSEDLAEQLLPIHNYAINVVPNAGWGPLSVKNIEHRTG